VRRLSWLRCSFLRSFLAAWCVFLLAGLLASCTPAPAGDEGLRVLAVETFLADMAQNVAGDRLSVAALMPLGVDPHSFEPTPQDIAKAAACQVLIVNGAGLEAFLEKTLQNIGGERQIIEASAGLQSRRLDDIGAHDDEALVDPHFWLDPLNAIHYVENIRDGLNQADPAGAQVYAANAAAYIEQLRQLDAWIAQQVETITPARRQLVTDHESFGYFADRYGFTIVGMVIPSVSTDASPSAQQTAQLIERIRAAGAPAIFLEAGANPQLADQVAREADVKVVADLYTHSITDAQGPAPTYIELMKHNTRAIVEALR